jgi:hypothetical protein
MTRVLAIALLLSAPLLASQRAAAQDCFCGTGAWQVTPTFGMDAALSDVEVAAETRDTTIVSVLVVAPRSERAPAAPAVLWCTSGNDPRCLPMQPSDAPAFQALSAGPVAVTVDATRPDFARVARSLTSVTPAEGLVPASGVTRSLDRPPRG